MTKYYTLDEIEKRPAKYYVMFGERSNGKTYAVLEKGLKLYFQTGKQLAIIRRWDDDYIGQQSARTCYDSLMCNGEGKNVIKVLSKGEYSGVEFFSGRYYLTTEDEDGKQKRTKNCIAIGFSLNSAEHYKSGSYPEVGMIFFDEFIATKLYLNDEFIMFQNLLSTIIRNRDDLTIYMAGNTISRYNPYFKEMGLYKAKTMKRGDIDVYTYGDSGLTVAVQFTDSPNKKKKSDIYFAFENPKLKMITNGAWQIDIYPHLPMKYKPKEILFTYFICFDDETFQCEIIRTKNMKFTYIHRKTTPIQDRERDFIYQQEEDGRPNIKKRITKPTTKLEKKITQYFADDKVFYQDNEVGDVIRSYIDWCRTQ